MNIKKIKIKLLERNMTMPQLASKVGISRELLYYKIKNQHKETMGKIKTILFLFLHL